LLVIFDAFIYTPCVRSRQLSALAEKNLHSASVKQLPAEGLLAIIKMNLAAKFFLAVFNNLN
jgi:hypothetical protein